MLNSEWIEFSILLVVSDNVSKTVKVGVDEARNFNSVREGHALVCGSLNNGKVKVN